jgi:carbonic anhydrase
MDTRVDVEQLLGLQAGDAHVIRNAGAIVTEDVLRSLELSRSLGTEETVVILHTDCAARDGDLDAAARAAAAEIGGRVRALVYDVERGSLREAQTPPA